MTEPGEALQSKLDSGEVWIEGGQYCMVDEDGVIVSLGDVGLDNEPSIERWLLALEADK